MADPAGGQGSRQARGGALDALRFFAALFVLVFHYGDEAPVALERLHGVFTRGYLATDFFLLLSGFVLARAYGAPVAEGRITPGGFLVKRIGRIYPAHLITLTCLIVAVIAAEAVGHRLHHHERFVWTALPANLLLIHAWGVGGGTWNVPSWTLSALAACYAAFPWLWRAVKRIEAPAACLVVVIGVLLAGDLIAHSLAGQEAFDLPFRWGVLRAVPLFLAGLGAEVIKIDDPATGDPTTFSPPFAGPAGVSFRREPPADIGIAYLKRARG